MKTTFKLLLDTRRANSQGTYPIRLRIFHGGDYKDFTPGILIKEQFWNNEAQEVIQAHPESNDLNASIEVHKSRLKKLLRLCELEGKPDPPLRDIISVLKREETSEKKSQSGSPLLSTALNSQKALKRQEM